jgi:hypothetical protein
MNHPVVYSVAIVLLGLTGCGKPDPEQIEFDKKFDRDAVLVKTCRVDPTIESAPPIRIYRFDGKLWFREKLRFREKHGGWRQIDGNPENVCDLLEVEQKRS